MATRKMFSLNPSIRSADTIEFQGTPLAREESSAQDDGVFSGARRVLFPGSFTAGLNFARPAPFGQSALSSAPTGSGKTRIV